MGRKPAENPTERMCIRIPPEDIAAVRCAAKREGMNLSALVSQFIRFGLAHMPQEGK